ncbi:hypothetical protein JTB14_036672 [Gonioctena quinquepunctata]|nr:hypothetical protein JTB14_036672 [Gonioctena quinquepunctata]
MEGGISVCSNRFSESNNKYMPNYDPSKPTKSLLYPDVNNLYGLAMSQPLPFGGSKWADTNIDVTMIPDDSSVGYILRVDLEYPKNIHDLHKDFPPTSKLSKLMFMIKKSIFYTKEILSKQ